jgi:hypothetical protein
MKAATKAQPVQQPEKPRVCVHVHKSVQSVNLGLRSLRQSATKGRREDLDTERTWAIEVKPKLAKRLVEGVTDGAGHLVRAPETLAAFHPGGVPLTHDEELAKVAREGEARVKVGQMTEALAELATREVTGGSSRNAR